MTRFDRWTRRPAAAVAALVVASLSAPAFADDAQRDLNLETFDRAWELVNQRYWDEDFGGLDWQGVKDELRPKAAEAENRKALRKILREMVGRLGQSHFGVIPARGETPSKRTGGPECALAFSERLQEILESEGAPGDATAGLDVRFLESGAFVTAVDEGAAADRAGVRTGWTVERVGEQPVSDILPCLGDELSERMQGRLGWEVLTGMLSGDPGDSVSVLFRDHQGAERAVELEMAIPSDAQTVSFGNLPPMQFRFATDFLERQPNTFGLIRFNTWMMPAAQQFEEAVIEMAKVEGMILDLRGNPGGVAGLSAGFAGYFVDEAQNLGTLKTRRDEIHLRINPRTVSRDGSKIDTYAGPVAILIDQFSASTSEIFAAGMQDLGRARIFGERSMAAALPAVIEELPNGDYLMHAMADLLRPSGERVEGEGVVPDQPVPLTEDGLRAGKDEVLEAALAWLAEHDSESADD